MLYYDNNYNGTIPNPNPLPELPRGYYALKNGDSISINLIL